MADQRSAMGALRAAAEAQLRQTASATHPPVQQNSALMHELQVHQLELEMQNELLRNALDALESARDRYVDLFEFAPLAYLTVSPDGKITEANLAAASILGISRKTLAKQHIERFVAPVDLARWRRHEGAARKEPGAPLPEFGLLLRRFDGAQFPARLHCMATGRPGSPATMRIALFDNTAQSAAEAEMQRLANYDPLTQLPNRRLFQDRLAQTVAASRRNGMYGAILFLDLDNFKALNDTLGHDAGDLLLIEVSNRLRSSLREGDTVARIGGDEFVMILDGLGVNEPDAAALAGQIGDKLIARIARPVAVEKTEYECTTSIGVRLFGPQDNATDLLKQADFALYQAKAAGRNQVRLFEPPP
ncbi:sensor domain-containing diguanylate cyclase [Pseudothauera lacus]|nr:sensor domain-containing diguanylate cyclase [Pseudothauera lacus]